MTHHWQSLRQGDIVDVVAPGYGTGGEAVQKGAEYLRSLGLQPRIPADLMGHHLLCSNTDEQRMHHLKNALYATDSKAIWCIKGGFGTTVIMPELLELEAPKMPKLLLGFSDISAIHLLLNNRWGWPSLHAPVLWQIAMDKIAASSLDMLKDVIFGKVKEVRYTLAPLNKHHTQLTTTITGGNLAILQTSLGTAWQLETKGKVVFLEEVDEQPYRVARMLAHMKQAGAFDEPAAVILGDFTIEQPFREAMETVLQEFAASCPFPVFRLPGIGHEMQNDPLPFGTKATLEHSTLRIETGAA